MRFKQHKQPSLPRVHDTHDAIVPPASESVVGHADITQ